MSSFTHLQQSRQSNNIFQRLSVKSQSLGGWISCRLDLKIATALIGYTRIINQSLLKNH